MDQWPVIAVLSVVEALRRLWQKITGRTPVPVRVPVRRWQGDIGGPVGRGMSSSRVWIETDAVVENWARHR